MHDRLQNLYQKVSNWKNSLQHFIETEGWTIENDSKAIDTLKKLIDDFSGTFGSINPNYSANGCEAFNKARCLLADKDTFWRLSWLLRAYIPKFIKLFWNEFDIYDNEHHQVILIHQTINSDATIQSNNINVYEEILNNEATVQSNKIKINEKIINHEVIVQSNKININ